MQTDITFIGALNTDYVVELDRGAEDRTFLEELFPEMEWGSEMLVAPDCFDRLKTAFAERIQSVQQGGSAFNALRAMRTVDPSLRPGFIGTVGDGPEGIGFQRWFRENQIATDYLNLDAGTPAGGCLAILHDGERTLFTTSGANRLTASFLEDNARDIIDWMARSNRVHVTSFLDDRAADVLVDMLGDCLSRNPTLVISIDPGAIWAGRYASDRSVRRLLNLAHVLFLNRQEFASIWGAGALTPEGFSLRMVNQPHLPAAQVVLKAPSFLAHFHSDKTLTAVHHQAVLTADEIANPVGTGDIVAGTFIAASLHDASIARRLAASSLVVQKVLRHDTVAEDDLASLFARALGRAGDAGSCCDQSLRGQDLAERVKHQDKLDKGNTRHG